MNEEENGGKVEGIDEAALRRRRIEAVPLVCLGAREDGGSQSYVGNDNSRKKEEVKRKKNMNDAI